MTATAPPNPRRRVPRRRRTTTVLTLGAAALTVVATGCVTVTQSASAGAPVVGAPFVVCAKPVSSTTGAPIAADGELVFSWGDGVGSGTVVPVRGGALACAGHVYQRADLFRIGAQFRSAGPDGWTSLTAGSDIRIIPEPDPPSFVTGYPVGADPRAWSFSFRDRWFSPGVTPHEVAGSSLEPFDWQALADDGTVVASSSGSTEWPLTFPGPGTYTVRLTTGRIVPIDPDGPWGEAGVINVEVPLVSTVRVTVA